MGIRFHCPNGHKLHVKGFLAGKRAICPKCGVKVTVPQEESPSTSAADADAESTASVTLEEIHPSQAVTSTAIDDSASSPVVSAVRPVVDPISEAPSAVWYVRPATGGQFGPASGEIMRGWINDGRVGASSLVWRAGWNEWRSAADAFPELSQLLVAPGPPLSQPAAASLPRGQVAEMLPPEAPAAEPSGAAPSLSEISRRRRRKKDVSLMASAVLVAITVILIIILALVFRAQRPANEPEADVDVSATG